MFIILILNLLYMTRSFFQTTLLKLGQKPSL